MVAILIEDNYSQSLWCKKKHAALLERLRAKRIAFCEIYDTCPRNIKSVFVIGSNHAWLNATIQQFNQNNIVPIVLCDDMDGMTGCVYNCVCSDIPASMRSLMTMVKAEGKTKIAIYGVNPTSLSDKSRTEMLMLSQDASIEKMTQFANEGSLKECFQNFYAVAQEYDCVICTNDFVAISLVKHLKSQDEALLSRLLILSCGASELLDHFRHNIITLDVNYNNYGKAAVYVYEALQKHEYISGLTVKVEWDLSFSIPSPPSKQFVLTAKPCDDSFYDDPELAEMMVADKLLTFSDDVDKKILDLLKQKLPVEDISQKCFLSINAIKYRIKNLIENSGAKDKTHIIRLMQEYCN